MKLHIELDMSGAALSPANPDAYEELGGILAALASGMTAGGPYEGPIIDSNGNTCGRSWTTED